MNSTKILKNDKLFDLEIYYFEMKYSDINLVETICENPTPTFKIKIRLFYAEGNVYVKTKNHELQNWIAKLSLKSKLDLFTVKEMCM